MYIHAAFLFENLFMLFVIHKSCEFAYLWLANSIMSFYYNLSRGMRFSTMWYVRRAKAQISLRIRTV